MISEYFMVIFLLASGIFFYFGLDFFFRWMGFQEIEDIENGLR